MLAAVVTLSLGDDPTDLNNARDYITDFQLAPAVALPRKAWTISPHERSGDQGAKAGLGPKRVLSPYKKGTDHRNADRPGCGDAL